MTTPAGDTAALVASPRVLFLNWRDTRNPDGGGSERYVESVARALVAGGATATIVCAAHEQAPPEDVDEGVRFVRRGGKLTVYPWAGWLLLTGRLGPYDAVVDVQNGVPFFSRLLTRRPVLVLVHHVHREQWPVVYGPTVARIGWWIESWLSPRVYRGCQYVAVSSVTRAELARLGVDDADIAVVHNGTDPAVDHRTARDPAPLVCVLGRLVPHKRVEHALRAVASLRDEVPGMRLVVVGDGWWSRELRDEAARLGVEDLVDFTGFVAEPDKQQLLARSWVLATPSLKEGWGLSVMEAATYGVPTVAYRQAGGVSESVVDGTTGLLVEDEDEFVAAIRTLLTDPELRERLGSAARQRAAGFTWEQTATSFRTILDAALAGRRRLAAVDPGSPRTGDMRVRPARLRHRRSGRSRRSVDPS